MSKNIRVAGMFIVALMLVVGLAGGEDAVNAPEIVGIDFPKEIPATGRPVEGFVFFTDPNGDLSRAEFQLLEGVDLESFTLDLTDLAGQTEGFFPFEIATTTPQKARYAVSLIDAEGHKSEPSILEFEARLYPDLVVELDPASVPEDLRPGQTLEITYTVHNAGGLPTDPFFTAFYLSADEGITREDLLLDSWEELGLGVAETRSRTLSVRIPEDVGLRLGPGGFIGLWADHLDQIEEGDEENNVVSVAVGISGVVRRGPIADFLAEPRRGPAPLSVRFTNASQGEFTEALWDFGDGTTSRELQPEHIYNTAGSYTVKLTVSGPGGEDTKTRVDYIIVESARPRPQARFSASPTSGRVPLIVRFDNQSENATGFIWDFGDGTTSLERNPEHTYWQAGSHTVRLTARGPGGEASAQRTIGVQPGRVLFEDDFSRPSGWCEESNPDVLYHHDTGRGVYIIEVRRSGGWLFWCYTPGGNTFSDFAVEVEARRTSGPPGAYGFVLRHNDAGYYIFVANVYGGASLQKYDANRQRWSTIVDWSPGGAVEPGSPDHIALIAQGSEFRLYLNGRLIAVANDSSFRRGRIGLLAWAYDEGGTRVEFDNLHIYEP